MGSSSPHVFTNWFIMAELITLEEYKEYANIQNERDDLVLDRLIAGVSQLVKTYCGHTFVDHSDAGNEKTEYFNIGRRESRIHLTEWPIISITSVSERTGYNVAYTPITAGAFQYFQDDSTHSLIRTQSSGASKYWEEGPAAVEVVYLGGYALGAIPADLMLAIVDLVTFYHRDEHKPRMTMGTATLNNADLLSRSRDFPAHIARVLNLYRG